MLTGPVLALTAESAASAAEVAEEVPPQAPSVTAASTASRRPLERRALIGSCARASVLMLAGAGTLTGRRARRGGGANGIVIGRSVRHPSNVNDREAPITLPSAASAWTSKRL